MMFLPGAALNRSSVKILPVWRTFRGGLSCVPALQHCSISAPLCITDTGQTWLLPCITWGPENCVYLLVYSIFVFTSQIWRPLVQGVSLMMAFDVSFHKMLVFWPFYFLIALFVIQVHFSPKLNILTINYTHMEFECHVLEVSTVNLVSNTLRTLPDTKPT